MNEYKLNTIEEAIEDFREGKFIIVVDDEDRENEGDLIIAAEKITPEKVNFMLKHARGVLCAPITISRCEELNLPHQVMNNTSVSGRMLDGRFGGRPCGYDSCLGRPDVDTGNLWSSGTYQSTLCARERCVAPCRTYGGLCGHVSPGRTLSSGGFDGNHE